MTTSYYIKLYHEILHDPKMGRMRSDLWQFTVQLFLIAGEVYQDGKLPSIPDIAWELRRDEIDVIGMLDELAGLKIVHATYDGYIVTNFAKRQAPIPGNERVSKFREKEKRNHYYGEPPVTEPLPEVTNTSNENVTKRYNDETKCYIDKDKDIDIDKIEIQTLQASAQSVTDPFSAMQSLVEQLTGYPITPVPKEIEAINHYVEQGITEDDIRAALAFYQEKGLIARGAASIEKSVMVAKAKRVQAVNARAGPNGSKPTLEDLGYTNITPQFSEAEIKQMLGKHEENQ